MRASRVPRRTLSWSSTISVCRPVPALSCRCVAKSPRCPACRPDHPFSISTSTRKLAKSKDCSEWTR
uniref:Putative secreted peptide n=1 Tax=Anopheles braziliensis TaxID=58242 RepID=A0A2M3ZPV2_9DIPT